jgi:hypothetical protein
MQTENEELIYKNKAEMVPGFSFIYPSSMIRYIERESIQRIQDRPCQVRLPGAAQRPRPKAQGSHLRA